MGTFVLTFVLAIILFFGFDTKCEGDRRRDGYEGPRGSEKLRHRKGNRRRKGNLLNGKKYLQIIYLTRG